MKLLNNKLAIVTGGTGDIGESIVKTFVKHGATVIFTFFSSEKKANQLEIDTNQYAISYKKDLSNIDSAKTLIHDVIEKYGNLDILVNNTGIIQDNLLIKMSEKEWDKVIKTNLYSVFNMTKYSIFPMIKQKRGNIINISSIIGLTGNIGQSNYAASKAGIIGFTKSISREFGKKNIRCNAISPGYISTKMNTHLTDQIKKEWIRHIPLGKPGIPQDVANCVLFLASNLSSYITGSVFNVNGGII
ncbi:3-oxoacyl-ACP reductase FabG [Blattabacterium cuenoti]|uniref:3-oxoacyl-ACP reductase FabG n=1 Tax=Blattabacterium cuenoti TaxID=1653831 RepID=UPI00163D0878|nr:3-oxoacyl-ACP reductase FabG [Blattabacterium cuenoti]